MSTVRERAAEQGFYLRVVPVERLIDLKNDIEAFASAEELNGFQQFIVGRYTYEARNVEFTARSIIIAARPNTPYGEAYFTLNGKEYKVFTPIEGDNEPLVKFIADTVAENGYQFAPARGWIPLKRLAVQSGLSVYGRNNIAYTGDAGSYAVLYAYFTDMPADEDFWREAVTSETCKNCGRCIKNCPTGAIREDRFLIDCERCITTFNEDDEIAEFPDSLPKDVHHMTFCCIRCQYGCPMNAAAHKSNSVPQVRFTEAETQRLMQGAPYDDLSDELRAKYDLCDLDSTGILPRNLRALFDVIDSGVEIKL